MNNPLSRKLNNYLPLSGADELQLVDALEGGRQIKASGDILLEGDDPRAVNVVLDGWACHFKQFEDGRRQITGLLVPGDSCDPHIFLLRRMGHGLMAVTPVLLAQLPGWALQDLTARSATLKEAFERDTLAVLATQREWIASLGRRSAMERLAHLFCELYARLEAVGLTDGPDCAMPLTQSHLADVLGQTSVHVNRTLQELRGAGLISLRNRRLTIHDRDGLSRLGLFNPDYLHLKDRTAPP